MKTANFKYQKPCVHNPIKNGIVTIFGKVTLKEDGKISISLNDAKSYRSGNVFAAKNLAKEIVNSDFKHVDAFDVIDTTASESLFGILTTKTQDLKDAYIDRTKVYAKSYFDRAKVKLAQPMEKWYEEFDIKYEYREPQSYDLSEVSKKVLTPMKEEYNKKGLYKMRNAMKELNDLIKSDYDRFEEKEVTHAINHYNNSVAKLAYRLEQKGVTLKKMKIKSAQIKMNFEITIDCDGIITRAWTIIAEGPIQRPHYRYLVK